jgi:Tfp pilus assembly protein PilE
MASKLNKKGLFLAEILLAVVIAAVIMGSAYLLFNDVMHETKRNQAKMNLESMISIFSLTYGESRVTQNPSVASAISETSSFVKTNIFPSVMDTRDDDNVYSAFSGQILVSPTGATTNYPKGTSIYFITYKDLKKRECSLFLRSIVKTKPIAYLDGEFKIGTPGLVCSSGVYNGDPFTYSSRLLLTRNKMCQQIDEGTRDLTIIYSPKKENYFTCKG